MKQEESSKLNPDIKINKAFSKSNNNFPGVETSYLGSPFSLTTQRPDFNFMLSSGGIDKAIFGIRPDGPNNFEGLLQGDYSRMNLQVRSGNGTNQQNESSPAYSAFLNSVLSSGGTSADWLKFGTMPIRGHKVWLKTKANKHGSLLSMFFNSTNEALNMKKRDSLLGNLTPFQIKMLLWATQVHKKLGNYVYVEGIAVIPDTQAKNHSQYQIAKELGVSRQTVNVVINQNRKCLPVEKRICEIIKPLRAFAGSILLRNRYLKYLKTKELKS